jgi:nucleoside phosphorylase
MHFDLPGCSDWLRKKVCYVLATAVTIGISTFPAGDILVLFRIFESYPIGPKFQALGRPAMSQIDVQDLILNFDPAAPQARFRELGVGAALAPLSSALPRMVPWPAGAAPTPAPLATSPKPDDDLSRFAGYDAVVVTWTAAEASALAALFTPGYPTSTWYEYKHDVASYIPLVTGNRAPFNSAQADMTRYYRSLGLYFPVTIGSKKILLFKSGLHLDYDGPATPVRKLMFELASVIKPKIFITTGTGGGIGADVALGDVVIAGAVRFDCVTQFKAKSFAKSTYSTAALPTSALAAITPGLSSINAAKITGARPVPKIFSSKTDTIVTTDFFGFDDSTDHYKLQGLGRACDMGDAMVADAVSTIAGLKFYAIRNASDPQMPNPTGNIEEANQQAGVIYARYGGLTTAASVIATWAVIHTN